MNFEITTKFTRPTEIIKRIFRDCYYSFNTITAVLFQRRDNTITFFRKVNVVVSSSISDTAVFQDIESRLGSFADYLQGVSTFFDFVYLLACNTTFVSELASEFTSCARDINYKLK